MALLGGSKSPKSTKPDPFDALAEVSITSIDRSRTLETVSMTRLEMRYSMPMTRRLRIALNLHFLRPEATGGGETYAVELVRALAEIDRTNEYMLFCNRGHERLALPVASNFKVIASPVNASVRTARYAWEQLVMPWQLRGRGFDLVHSMGYVAPLLAPLKQLVTIPDANWQDLDIMSPAKRRSLGFFVRRSATMATMVLTGTHAAARRLEENLPANCGPIVVVPLGADHLPPPVDTPLPGPTTQYILALSGTLTHKNIPRLIEAFGQIAGQVPHTLVIAGHVPPAVRSAAEATAPAQRIHWTGYVSDEILAGLYARAALFVFPSWHEGFGLPLLEAQRVGAPTAVSAIPALMEIANGSAELFDPFVTESIAAAMLRVLKSPERRRALIDAAYANAASYTWGATARATLAAYEQVASGHRTRPRRARLVWMSRQ